MLSGRWQPSHLAWKIGAMSFVNVGVADGSPARDGVARAGTASTVPRTIAASLLCPPIQASLAFIKAPPRGGFQTDTCSRSRLCTRPRLEASARQLITVFAAQAKA